MKVLGQLVVGVLLATIGVIVNGFVYMKLWMWFVVPAFSTVPALNLKHAIGISVFISILKYRRDDKEKDFEESVSDWFVALIYSFVALGFAYVVYSFIQ